MVIPAIATGARVVKKIPNRVQAAQKQAGNKKPGAARLLAKGKSGGKQMRALVALSWLWPIVPFQILLALASALGIAIEIFAEDILWGFGAWLVPAGEIALGLHFVVFFIGLVCMLTAIPLLIFRGINVFKLNGGLWFMICLGFYFVPLLNAFPWVFLWGWRVGNQ
ncbi:MAG: hypothetical protein R3B69_02600 [Candidatus Paceibacterota bacterium]